MLATRPTSRFHSGHSSVLQLVQDFEPSFWCPLTHAPLLQGTRQCIGPATWPSDAECKGLWEFGKSSEHSIEMQLHVTHGRCYTTLSAVIPMPAYNREPVLVLYDHEFKLGQNVCHIPRRLQLRFPPHATPFIGRGLYISDV
jgi:hypothetical protein